MSLPPYFISCDWGTTNFRLRVVETETLAVLHEVKTDQGIRVLYEQFTRQKEVPRQHFFANYLKEQMARLPPSRQDYPVVLSGMASSSIGLEELDYADFPFDQSGERLIAKAMSLHNGLNILLISGVKSETGMMRGEETQAIGLGEHIMPYGRGILVLPGTHSKHLKYTQGVFTGLTNFMTGELFEVLSRKSILAGSVENGQWTKTTEAAFKAGLSLGFNGRLSSSLLLVRAHHVIRGAAKADNYYFLSGLLIGDELSGLSQETDKVFLAAPDPVFSLYKSALEHFFDADRLVFFDDRALEAALLMGQKIILTR